MLAYDITALYMYCYHMTPQIHCVHVLFTIYHGLGTFTIWIFIIMCYVHVRLLPYGISNLVHVLYTVQPVSFIPQG